MKCEIDLHYGAVACSEKNSLNRLCQVKARLPAMAFDDGQSSLRRFPRNCSIVSLITKDYSGRFRAYLAVSTEQVSFQTSEGAKSMSHFTMGLMAPHMIVITLH